VKRQVVIYHSRLGTLRLTYEEAKAYREEEAELFLKYYKLERDDAGIWASAQHRYVKSQDEFNLWDDKQMEDLWEAHYGK